MVEKVDTTPVSAHSMLLAIFWPKATKERKKHMKGDALCHCSLDEPESEQIL